MSHNNIMSVLTAQCTKIIMSFDRKYLARQGFITLFCGPNHTDRNLTTNDPSRPAMQHHRIPNNLGTTLMFLSQMQLLACSVPPSVGVLLESIIRKQLG